MKIRPVGAELFHAERRTGRHEEANSRFFFFCNFAKVPKKISRSQCRSNLIIYRHKFEYCERLLINSTQAIHTDWILASQWWFFFSHPNCTLHWGCHNYFS